MNKKIIKIKFSNAYFILLILFIISCKSKNNENDNDESMNNSFTIEQENNDDEVSNERNNYSENVIENNYSGCEFEDGNYSATVDYNNSETGYSATYTLDVEVSDCQVVRINFPNDGYLDEDHISYADIDEDGTASVDGEDGKTYQIQIDD